ncbi:MAG: LysM peptidoglycan-binding domain-containing protein [Anaerolineae bacterium]|nr:LysM peptidoglycan-binding domain-containing protein [Anaerolineae bacterium]MCO5192629.1 LysM peptidoglycan-binding domain-containing protein [Anaerolineae bacterium]
MERLWRIPRQWLIVVVLGALLVAVGAIVLSAREPYNPPDMPVAGVAPSSSTGDGQFAPQSSYAGTPTPNPTPVGWSLDDQSVQTRHTVAAGETLGYIGQLYGVSAEEIAAASSLANLDSLEIGQSLIIPIQNDIIVGPDNKIIPDSELVYGPAARDFDVRAFVQPFNSYLLRYQETVEGQPLNGTDIVQLAADRLMVNPRLLLAALEYQSGWVTQPTPNDDGFPLGYYDPNIAGLYEQLIWAGDRLNGGFYGRAEGGLTTTTLLDGTRVLYAPEINDGTAGVQNWLAVRSGTTYATWLDAVGPDGFYATYETLFGRSPFAYTVEPLLPANLQQPTFTLPWTDGDMWFFSGGPHGGWASGSAWAALDFAPDDGAARGCYDTDKWVTAIAPGTVTRSDFGAVVVDLDGDEYAGTGWAVLYQHIATSERVPVGTRVQVGDNLGHPSCEGGFSSATHLHLARTYNGRWISADGAIPFNLNGWLITGSGSEYNGVLEKNGVVKEACAGCRDEVNSLVGGQ